MQIDAERWQYDNVSADTIIQFASLLSRSGLPGWKVTYASRGQYSNSLLPISTPLWNADYRGSVNGSYPGDNWASGWAPYSGQTPIILQYTSTPYDKNAYRGTLEQLLALTGGGNMADINTDYQGGGARDLAHGKGIGVSDYEHDRIAGAYDQASQSNTKAASILSQAQSNGSGISELKAAVAGISTGGGLSDGDRALIQSLLDAVNALSSRLASP